MIKILNQQLQAVAILENAFGIGYDKAFNQLWTAKFSLPLNDPKNAECKSLYRVEIYDDDDEYIGLFRIIPKLTVKNESTQTVTYQCEHVLATLLDKSFFLYHQIDGLPTSESIDFVLDQQEIKHWVLGTVEITRYFSYKWENGNLLSALFSIPKPFDVPYRWIWDTHSYPWTLNLVVPDSEPTCEITEGKNLIGLEIEENPMGIFNRIYPLGYGEGDNQLTIASVNGGIPYIEDAESVAEYGPREYIWVDKRFEDATILKANVEALLKKWKEPIITWKASAVDISKITGEDIDKFKEGRVVRINTDDFGVVDLRIMKESKSDVTGKPWDVQLDIGNLTEDLSTTQSDMERRQQINELYAQGATNMDSHDFEDNADTTNPAVMKFYLPEEMVRVNRLDLTFECTNFRAYSKAVKGGGGVIQSTSSGGSSTQTSSTGGQATVTSAGGGGTTATSSNYVEAHYMTGTPENSVGTENWGYHLHEFVIPGHDHTVSIPTHTHSVSVPSHTHSVDTPAHTHGVTLTDHTHDLEYGIYKHSEMPTEVTIMIDGNIVPHTNIEGENVDLIPYLAKDTDGKIKRGWHIIEITPNDLARISAQVTSQFFIQSRGQYSL
ncbi:MAG: hypothetical protein K0S80_4509 [Neobacillus sp.]|nr:hypothetical protein [Neobacillus sp.]